MSTRTRKGVKTPRAAMTPSRDARPFRERCISTRHANVQTHSPVPRKNMCWQYACTMRHCTYIYIYIYIRAREAEKVSRAARRHSSPPSTVSGILRGDQSACTSRLVRGNRLRGASPGHKTRFTIETVADAANSRCTRVSRAIAFQFPLIRRNGSGEDAFFYSKSEKHAPISNSVVSAIPIAPSQIAASSLQAQTGNRRERRFAFINYSREHSSSSDLYNSIPRGSYARGVFARLSCAR